VSVPFISLKSYTRFAFRKIYKCTSTNTKTRSKQSADLKSAVPPALFCAVCCWTSRLHPSLWAVASPFHTTFLSLHFLHHGGQVVLAARCVYPMTTLVSLPQRAEHTSFLSQEGGRRVHFWEVASIQYHDPVVGAQGGWASDSVLKCIHVDANMKVYWWDQVLCRWIWSAETKQINQGGGKHAMKRLVWDTGHPVFITYLSLSTMVCSLCAIVRTVQSLNLMRQGQKTVTWEIRSRQTNEILKWKMKSPRKYKV